MNEKSQKQQDQAQGYRAEKLLERETTIRWDEGTDHAVLWTATPAVKREWASYGFEVVETPGGGWRAEVPKDRVSYKPLKKR